MNLTWLPWMPLKTLQMTLTKIYLQQQLLLKPRIPLILVGSSTRMSTPVVKLTLSKWIPIFYGSFFAIFFKLYSGQKFQTLQWPKIPKESSDFDDFWTGLKLHDFRWLFKGARRWGLMAGWWWFGCFLGSIAVTKQSGGACKIHYQTRRNRGIRKNQDANYEYEKSRLQYDLVTTEAGYRIEELPRSLLTPLRGAGGF